MIEVTVAHLGLDRTTNTPVVILREKEGSRVLPIWIGPAEASAIAMDQLSLIQARTIRAATSGCCSMLAATRSRITLAMGTATAGAGM